MKGLTKSDLEWHLEQCRSVLHSIRRVLEVPEGESLLKFGAENRWALSPEKKAKIFSIFKRAEEKGVQTTL